MISCLLLVRMVLVFCIVCCGGKLLFFLLRFIELWVSMVCMFSFLIILVCMLMVCLRLLGNR